MDKSSRSRERYPQGGEYRLKKSSPSGQLNIGVVILSSDYRVVGINKYAADILQISPSAIGKKVYKYHSPKTHASIKYLLNKASNAPDDILPPIIMNVLEKVLAVNLCRIEMKEASFKPIFTMTFVDITGQAGGVNHTKQLFGIKKLPVYDRGSYLFLDAQSICLIKSEGNYCRVFSTICGRR